MDVDQHIAALQNDGRALAAAAEAVGLDDSVPSCPKWQVRDLLVHLGFVHRWATNYVARALTERMQSPSENEVLESGPGAPQLLGWFREGHAALVDALSSADPALACWSFLDAPSPRAFWARRQAHETAIHRADVELADGAVTPFEPTFAADGIDELVMGFAPTQRSKAIVDEPRILVVRAEDTGDTWQIRFGPAGVTTERGSGRYDSHLSGSASDLYLLLWNRSVPSEGTITVTGDSNLVELWGQNLRVRW